MCRLSPSSPRCLTLLSLVSFGLGACFPDPAILDRVEGEDTSDAELTAEDVSDVPWDDTPDEGRETEPAGCVDEGDCGHLIGPCQDVACVEGGCQVQDREGLPCDDGDACTHGDVCTEGACSGTTLACDDALSCRGQGFCEPTNGECVYPAVPNGTPCDDGDRCTAGDACLDGQCRGTRTPDDSLGDWVLGFTGTATAQVAGLRALTGGVQVLVNLQVDQTLVEPGTTLSLGSQASVTVPAGSTEAIALFSIRYDGRPQDAFILAHGAGRIRATNLDVLDTGVLVVAGEGRGQAIIDASRTIDLGSEPDDGARTFVLRVQNGQVVPGHWIGETSVVAGFSGFRGVVALGTDCVIVLPVARDQPATLSNARGQVATLAGEEAASLGAWIVWLPGCVDIVGIQRYVRPAAQGALAVTAVDGSPTGEIALVGFSMAGLKVGPAGAPGEVTVAAGGPRAFMTRLDARGQVVMTESIADSAGEGVVFPWAVKADSLTTLYSLDLLGQSNLYVDGPDGTGFDMPGGPASALDTRPRAVIVKSGRANGFGERWFHHVSFPDYEGKSGSTFGAIASSGSSRVVTVSSHDDVEDVSESSKDLWTVRVLTNSGQPLLSHRFLEPTDRLQTTGPTFVGVPPGSESVVVSGTLAGRGRVLGTGSLGLEVDVDPSSGGAVLWVQRLNSDDGIGCP